MKNNRRVKMLAWIMAAIMVLCTVPLTAFAADGDYVPPVVIGPFKIEETTADVSVSYQTTDGTAVPLLSTADRNQSYQMVLTVNQNDSKAILPANGEMLFDLPSVIDSAEGGSNETVQWTYNSQNRTLSFTWIGAAGKSFAAKINVSLGNEYDVYNAAKINGTYYRLKKTTVKTVKPATAYKGGTKLSNVDPDYEAEDYDFENLDITDNGITYIYCGKQDVRNPLPYYTVKLIKEVSVVENNIGCMSNGKANWINDVELFSDVNKTTGYHRDFEITLFDSPVMEEQPLYNFIQVGNLYYRLKRTAIIAKNLRSCKGGVDLLDGEFELVPDEDYDFSHVVVTDDKGEEYRYSATDLSQTEELYESYYTVSLNRIFPKHGNMHGNASWYKNPKGWLDGAEATYTSGETNGTWAFHRDYLAELHKGNAVFHNVTLMDGDNTLNTVRAAENREFEPEAPEKEGETFLGWTIEPDGTEPSKKVNIGSEDVTLYAQWGEPKERKVTITSNWEGEYGRVGDMITLTAHVEGFEEGKYTLQWEYSTDKEVWIPEPGATGVTFTYRLDEITTNYYWRVVAIDVK